MDVEAFVVVIIYFFLLIIFFMIFSYTTCGISYSNTYPVTLRKVDIRSHTYITCKKKKLNKQNNNIYFCCKSKIESYSCVLRRKSYTQIIESNSSGSTNTQHKRERENIVIYGDEFVLCFWLQSFDVRFIC